jgi:hypothetical protein
MEILTPKRELPTANAKCMDLKMVLGERPTLSIEMLVPTTLNLFFQQQPLGKWPEASEAVAAGRRLNKPNPT